MIFIDTEFTDLMKPQLLSMGLVSLRGDECYVELDLSCPVGKQRLKDASDFVKNIVLPQWGKVQEVGDEVRMAEVVYDWLGRQEKSRGPLQVAADYSADFDLLAQLLTLAPQWKEKPLFIKCLNINNAVAPYYCQLANEQELLRQKNLRGIDDHHALADAWALRAAWLAKNPEKNPS